MKQIGAALILLVALTIWSFAQSGSPSFGPRVVKGTLNTDLIDEASGLAASRLNENVLWTHNDNGDSARIFAITTDAELLGIYNLKNNARNHDWEDIAIGPGPATGVSYIYIGDIGDNTAKRNTIQVYRIPEPVVTNASNPPNPNNAPSFNITSNIEQFNFKYPDGKHNAETLMVDPISKDLFIVAKTVTRPDSANIRRVYVCRAASLVTNQTITLQFVASVVSKAPGSTSNRPTGGDISADGSLIAMKTAGDLSSGCDVFIWPRSVGATVEQTMQANPLAPVLATKVPGEAITFAPDGSGYYAMPEGLRPLLYFVPRTN